MTDVSPRRLSVTVTADTFKRLTERATREGRTISNLAAQLLREQLNLTDK